MFNVCAITINMSTTTCASCGVVFSIPDHLMAKRREDGGAFFCPNGHSLTFGASELSKAQTRLNNALSKLEFSEAALSRERAQTAKLERKVKRTTKT